MLDTGGAIQQTAPKFNSITFGSQQTLRMVIYIYIYVYIYICIYVVYIIYLCSIVAFVSRIFVAPVTIFEHGTMFNLRDGDHNHEFSRTNREMQKKKSTTDCHFFGEK